MAGCVCVSRGRRSARVERARDGVMKCGRAPIGKAIVIGDDVVRSFIECQQTVSLGRLVYYLLEQVCCQHQHLGVWPVALHGTKIADPFLMILGRGHDFEDVEGGPGHVVSKHLKVD